MELNINELEKFLEKAEKETKDLNDYEKFDYLIKNNQISISSIQRLFNYSYPKAEKVINGLINCKAIVKKENSYRVLSMPRYYDFVSVYVSDKAVDYNGDTIMQVWINFAFGYKKETDLNQFPLDRFKQLVKDTCLYFQQLNTINKLSIDNKLDISFHSCMRIISCMNAYSSYKVVIEDCDYNDYNDLKHYPKTNCQITIKATQLITESLAFAISLIPTKKLTNTIGVIYNGTTTDYDIEKQNIEDIIKIVTEFPYSKK